MKKSFTKSSQQWLQEHFDDPFVKKAKHEGYRSRAVYKLIEIQEKDKLIRQGMMVVDLGAAPGSWTQVARQWIGKHGCLIALDILPMDSFSDVEFIQGDFRDEEVFQKLLQTINNRPVDLVISDMAPNFSGTRSVDQPRSMYLAELALEFAGLVLKENGDFLVKVFQGTEFQDFVKILRTKFTKVLVRKPKASRPRSNEIYLLARGFKIE